MKPSYALLAALLAAVASADTAATAFEAKSNKFVEHLYASRDLKIHRHEQEDVKESSKILAKHDPDVRKGEQPVQQQPAQKPAQRPAKQPEEHEAVNHEVNKAAEKPVQQPVKQPTKQPEKHEAVNHAVQQVAAGFTNTSGLVNSSTMEENKSTISRCAVCFIGQLRNLKGAAASIRNNFLVPIAKQGGVLVDVFVAAEQGGPHTIADFDFRGESGADIRFINSTWRAHQTAREIEQEVFKQNLPMETLVYYAGSEKKGNWLGPIFDNPGNGMRVYRLEKDCLDMVREEEMKSQKSYSWVIRTRPDFKWLVPHPPLSLFQRDRVWVLDGQHFQGVNNRHVVGSRDDMFKLLDRQRPIMQGDPIVFKMKRVAPVLNDEYWMLLLGFHAKIKWGRIQYIGYLQKNPEWVKTGWRPAGSRYDNEQLEAEASLQEWQHKKNACWKISSWREALEIAECSKEGLIETKQSSTPNRLRR